MSGLPRESKRGRRAERSMFDLRAAGPSEIAGRAEPEIYHLPIGTGKGAGGKGQKKGLRKILPRFLGHFGRGAHILEENAPIRLPSGGEGGEPKGNKGKLLSSKAARGH